MSQNNTQGGSRHCHLQTWRGIRQTLPNMYNAALRNQAKRS